MDFARFLEKIQQEVMPLVTSLTIEKCGSKVGKLLRCYFKHFASKTSLHSNGLNFFSQFDFAIKNLEFNPIKNYLLYFAYQLNNLEHPLIKELLSQHLIKAGIYDSGSYLDFCMYCFYRGMIYIENKNFFMASYYFSVVLDMGFNSVDKGIILNNFVQQMIKMLFFLKYLSDFNLSEVLFKEERIEGFSKDSFNTGDESIDKYLKRIKADPLSLKDFQDFCKDYNDEIKNFKLLGLKNAAEDEIKFNIIKNYISDYKRIKLAKVVSEIGLQFDDVLRILKKNVVEGRINIKYDEIDDIIEVFDIEVGLKKNCEENQKIYKIFIESNKNLFVQLKLKKSENVEFGNLSEEEQIARMIERQEIDFNYQDQD